MEASTAAPTWAISMLGVTTWEISLVGLIVIAGFIGLVLLLIARKKWIGLAMILIILAGLVSMKFYAILGPPPPVDVAYLKLSEQVAAEHPIGSDPTLEALWDKLTESKIQIEPDPDYVPDLSKEETRKKVAKQYGTESNGDMPPNWVLSPNKVIGEVFRRTVDSDPFVTEAECRRQLEHERLPEVVKNRLEQLLPSKVNRKVVIDDLAQYGIGLDFILREICVDEFTATVDTSVGPMKKVHVLMEFSQWEDDALISKWMQHEGDIRLARFGKIAGLSLTGLALAWGLLRFDTYSRGYYSKQLLGGSVLAIIALGVYLLRS